MQRIINFTVKYKEYIALVALNVICFSLISMGDVSRIGGYRTFVIGSIGWLQEIFAWIPNPAALKNENKAVRELNRRLSAEVIRMRQSLLENKRLRAMIGFAEKLNVPFVPAEVTGRTIIEMRSYITINRGSASGISEGMSVRTDAGLTGVVTAVTNNYSLVEILLNRNIRIASKIQRNGITGIVSWEGGNNLYLKNIPETFDIQIGDVILTSNYSNKYPEDIPIGQIINIEKDPSSLFLKVTVKPFVNFASLEEVFVIKQLPDPERISLIKEMQKRLQLMKGSD